MYSLSKKELKGEDEISDNLCKDCKVGHGKCSFFVLKSPHQENTPFQAAQKEHCPHRNHATHLCRGHGPESLVQINSSLFSSYGNC